jgi:Mn2+/Fe2+ NRAMP family transporter
MTLKQRMRPIAVRVLLLFSTVGPGLIAASADNDAPGIATYSIAGSAYGYRFVSFILLVTVGEVVVQEMAARMGAVTGKGTADLIRERYGLRVTSFAMLCLLLANLGTTAAQLAGVAAAGELLGISRYLAVPLAALFVAGLGLSGTYRQVEKALLVLSLSELSYVAAVLAIHPPWDSIVRQAVTPTLQPDAHYLLTLLATIGTTVAPWSIVYVQAAVADKGLSKEVYRQTRLDVVSGAALGNLVSACIIICTAATLFPVGLQVESAEQAALALAPVAGAWASMFFAAGLLGASILATSVLPLSTAYAICEGLGWERGLNRSRADAPVFYGLYAGMIAVGALAVLVPGMPLFSLMWLSQAANAIFLPVLLILLLKLANSKQLMGPQTNNRLQNALVAGLTGFVGAVTLVLLASPWLA